MYILVWLEEEEQNLYIIVCDIKSNRNFYIKLMYSCGQHQRKKCACISSIAHLLTTSVQYNMLSAHD